MLTLSVDLLEVATSLSLRAPTGVIQGARVVVVRTWRFSSTLDCDGSAGIGGLSTSWGVASSPLLLLLLWEVSRALDLRESEGRFVTMGDPPGGGKG